MRWVEDLGDRAHSGTALPLLEKEAIGAEEVRSPATRGPMSKTLSIPIALPAYLESGLQGAMASRKTSGRQVPITFDAQPSTVNARSLAPQMPGKAAREQSASRTETSQHEVSGRSSETIPFTGCCVLPS